MKNIFFQSSLPRSMSTLLQNILSQNPDIHGTGTDGSLELLYAARNNYTNSLEFKAGDPETMLSAWRGFCWGGLEGYANSLSDKKNICIKSRGIGIHYNWYKAFMPYEPKIICMVRDLKSIICSMEKIFRTNQENNQPIQNHAQMTGTTTEKRIDEWINSAPVGLALERTKQMILEGIADNVLFVRAEDLTKHPGREMERIYEYLGLSNFSHDFNDVKQLTIEDDQIYGLSPNLHKIKNKVEYSHPSHYAILGKSSCSWIDNNFSWYKEYFNY